MTCKTTEFLLIFLVNLELLIFNMQLGISLVGRAVRVPKICQSDLQTLAQWFIVYVMGDRNCLHHGSLNLGYIAWSHFVCVRPHREQSAETATSNARCSQLSGEVLSAEVGIFDNLL